MRKGDCAHLNNAKINSVERISFEIVEIHSMSVFISFKLFFISRDFQKENPMTIRKLIRKTIQPILKKKLHILNPKHCINMPKNIVI
jgi:hypothetical protein